MIPQEVQDGKKAKYMISSRNCITPMAMADQSVNHAASLAVMATFITARKLKLVTFQNIIFQSLTYRSATGSVTITIFLQIPTMTSTI
jgi:hypothetical protein